jgi:peptide-methionine (S)-S-oxide reductase
VSAAVWCWGLAGLIVGNHPVAAGVPRTSPGRATVVLAGGCYWGVESVYRHVRGVVSATSGYATPEPGSGSTEPVEAVRVAYDPSRISYRQILGVFLLVAHDPTQRDGQGPDVGAEYRSVVFVAGDRERAVVRGLIDSLARTRTYGRPIVTEISALRAFHPAGGDQQNYAARHPTDPYIVANDVPKLSALRRRFPALYRD